MVRPRKGGSACALVMLGRLADGTMLESAQG